MSNVEKAKAIIRIHIQHQFSSEAGGSQAKAIAQALDKANLLRQDGELPRILGYCKDCKHWIDPSRIYCVSNCETGYCDSFEPTASKKDQEAKPNDQSYQPRDLNAPERNTGREISPSASKKPVEPPVCPGCGHTDARWIKADGGFWLCNNCGCNITYVLKKSKEGRWIT